MTLGVYPNICLSFAIASSATTYVANHLRRTEVEVRSAWALVSRVQPEMGLIIESELAKLHLNARPSSRKRAHLTQYSRKRRPDQANALGAGTSGAPHGSNKSIDCNPLENCDCAVPEGEARGGHLVTDLRIKYSD